MSLPTAAKNLTIEPESPVNKKSLAKALTPPVTLRNFFKPKAGPRAGELNLTAKEGSGTVSCVTDAPSLSLKSNSSEIEGVCDNATSRQEVKTSVRGAEISASKARGTQMKLTASFAKAPSSTSRENPVLVDEETAVELELKRKGEKGQNVMLGKRKSEDCPPVMAARKRRAVARCPVCGKEFVGISNVDLNHHLDSCLTIQPPPS